MTFEKYNFIFLLYLSRSGSTYFSRLLAENGKNLTVLPETNYFSNILSHFKIFNKYDAKSVSNLIFEDPKFRLFNITKESLDVSLILCDDYDQAIQEVTKIILEKEGLRHSENVLVKDGRLIDFLKEIKILFTLPKILFIQRDPRGCINSLLHSPKIFIKGNSSMGWNDIEMCCNSYETYLKKINNISENFQIFKISYEALVKSEAETIHDSLQYLELSLVDSKNSVAESFIRKQEKLAHKNVFETPDDARISAWQKELDAWEIEFIEFRLGQFIPETARTRIKASLSMARTKAKAYHVLGLARLNLYRINRYVFNGNFKLLFLKFKLKANQ
jgi:sulfotransferase family protein